MSAVEEIRLKLETRLQEVETEIESLRAGLAALEAQAVAEAPVATEAPAATKPPVATEAPPAAKAPGATKARAPKTRTRDTARPRRRTSSENGHGTKSRGPSRAELEQLLIQAGGPEALELAQATGADYGVVLARIRELEQAGQPRG